MSSAIGSVSFDEFCTVMAMGSGDVDMTDEEFVDMLFEVVPARFEWPAVRFSCRLASSCSTGMPRVT